MLWGIIFVPSSDKFWGVYLTAYLGTSSHISSLSLHLPSCGGVYLTGYLGTSSHISSWSLHLRSCGRYIWTPHLFRIDQHRSAKNSPPGTGSFILGGISEQFICFKWALIDNMDQWRTLLLALAVSYGGYIWEHYLKIWTHFGFDICFTGVFSTKYQWTLKTIENKLTLNLSSDLILPTVSNGLSLNA